MSKPAKSRSKTPKTAGKAPKASGKAAAKSTSPRKKAAVGNKAAVLKAVQRLTSAKPKRSMGVPERALLNPGSTAAVLDRLFETVMARRDADPNVSHSARLLSRGTHKVAQKFGEEAVECLIEAVAGNGDKLIGESADVLYHLIVLWVDAGLRPDAVWNELRRREGVSGIAEKASRARWLPGAAETGD